MNEDILKLKNDIEELQKKLKNLESDTTISLEVGKAITKRVISESGDTFSIISTSTKSATSENKSVNEGGAATYSVMDKPDGFVEVLVGGTLIYLPYFL